VELLLPEVRGQQGQAVEVRGQRAAGLRAQAGPDPDV
jgi:hypothetical protein